MIYGDVDIHEIYDAPAEIRALARERVGMLAPRRAIDETNGQLALLGSAWGQVVMACPGQPMMDQISVGYCSVTLVAPDLAATAYHCLGWLGCDELAIVRGYQFRASSVLEPLDANADVRGCAEILTPVLEPGDPPPEIGWIHLSAPFAPFETLLPLGDAPLGAPVISLAHLGGIPLKLLDGANVHDEQVEQDARILVTNLDSFHGASGAPVLNEKNELAALVASGAPDFLLTNDDCLLLNEGPSEPGEERAVVYADLRSRACLEPEDPACLDGSAHGASTSGCSIGREHAGCRIPWVAFALLLAHGGRRSIRRQVWRSATLNEFAKRCEVRRDRSDGFIEGSRL